MADVNAFWKQFLCSLCKILAKVLNSGEMSKYCLLRYVVALIKAAPKSLVYNFWGQFCVQYEIFTGPIRPLSRRGASAGGPAMVHVFRFASGWDAS